MTRPVRAQFARAMRSKRGRGGRDTVLRTPARRRVTMHYSDASGRHPAAQDIEVSRVPMRVRRIVKLFIASCGDCTRRTSMPKRSTRHPTDSSPPDYSAIPSSDATITPRDVGRWKRCILLGQGGV
ncbi:uncharacterized protein TRAVEDRAFT_61278 [Trametes versicolor FP-101664 SS1]|uniref:uncharacterized protein n=1 Tax=Trametes versicolor (strain FP-101664) TaxID=717944 RepID=UPI00046237DD|nr:uncharacterized protein TRAVEDRAFT_61278 [Trametes versicolor FP-101664 SS1]EIW52260.1 hypothetical protein TRAVEDRAFT_61278 [Trametes versicolor FP-101664 SS1]